MSDDSCPTHRAPSFCRTALRAIYPSRIAGLLRRLSRIRAGGRGAGGLGDGRSAVAMAEGTIPLLETPGLYDGDDEGTASDRERTSEPHSEASQETASGRECETAFIHSRLRQAHGDTALAPATGSRAHGCRNSRHECFSTMRADAGLGSSSGTPAYMPVQDAVSTSASFKSQANRPLRKPGRLGKWTRLRSGNARHRQGHARRRIRETCASAAVPAVGPETAVYRQDRNVWDELLQGFVDDHAELEVDLQLLLIARLSQVGMSPVAAKLWQKLVSLDTASCPLRGQETGSDDEKEHSVVIFSTASDSEDSASSSGKPSEIGPQSDDARKRAM